MVAKDTETPKDLSKVQKRRMEGASVVNRDTGYVYFIEAAGFIKIGYSCRVRQRLSALGTLRPSPFALNIIGVIAGSYSLESELHKRFAAHRDNGEWFKDCSEIREFIQSCKLIELPRLAHRNRSAIPKKERRATSGRPPSLMPCPWCRVEFPTAAWRTHCPKCPQQDGTGRKLKKEN